MKLYNKNYLGSNLDSPSGFPGKNAPETTPYTRTVISSSSQDSDSKVCTVGTYSTVQ